MKKLIVIKILETDDIYYPFQVTINDNLHSTWESYWMSRIAVFFIKIFGVKEKVKLLSADSKPYEVDGNSGVSHKARFLIHSVGEIYNVRATESQVKELQSHLQKDGEVVLAFKSPKENLRVELVSFEF